MSLWLALGGATLLAALARRPGWLTSSGAVAAGVVGGLVFWGAGPAGAGVLGLFFVSGSLLTVSNRRRAQPAHRPPSARDARQVLANGGWAAAGALAVPLRPDLGWPLLVGALATAQADTWATEIGARSVQPPRLITTRVPVPPGTSGGVTRLGTLGGALGALAIGALALLGGIPPRVALIGAAAGLVGMHVDSVLGAVAQAQFHCTTCNEPCERRIHRCGQRASALGGWAWLDNDGVNLAATTFGSLAAAAASLAFRT